MHITIRKMQFLLFFFSPCKTRQGGAAGRLGHARHLMKSFLGARYLITRRHCRVFHQATRGAERLAGTVPPLARGCGVTLIFGVHCQNILILCEKKNSQKNFYTTNESVSGEFIKAVFFTSFLVFFVDNFQIDIMQPEKKLPIY